MPGINQLKQFSSNLLNLGDEVKVRAARGEKPAVFPIPPDTPDVDDADDFVLGMPNPEESNEADEKSVDDTALENNSSADTNQSPSIPIPGDDISANDIDIDSLLNNSHDLPDNDSASLEDSTNPMPQNVADMDLDSLLGDLSDADIPSQVEDFSSSLTENDGSDSSLEMPDLSGVDLSDTDLQEIPASENDGSSDLYDPNADFEDDDSSYGGINLNEELPSSLSEIDPEALQPKIIDDFDGDLTDTGFETSNDDFDSTDLPSGGESFDAPEMDEITDLDDDGGLDVLSEESTDDTNFTADSVPDAAAMSLDDLSLDDSPVDASLEASDDLFDMPDLGSSDSETQMDAPNPQDSVDPFAGDFGFDDTTNSDLTPKDDMSLDDLDFGTASNDLAVDPTEIPDTADLPTDFTEESTPEVFDTSDIDDLNFSDTASSDDSDADSSTGLDSFEIKDTDSQFESDDFDLGGDDDFAIPGFSDTTEADFNKSVPAPSIGKPEKKAGQSAKQKNSLTDEEFEKFQKNLKFYPLNIKIAVEDLIVKNEFTDEVVFDVITRIIKKDPVRQVASHLEKLLDVSLPVPRDFERRTVEEYNQYKASLDYQLKNKIIPIALLGIGFAIIALFLFFTCKQFIYRPLKANSLYKQGYELLQADEYPQSEQMFTEAVTYRTSEKWSFKYARGYREHKQYNRASQMYDYILKRFNNEKQAALEYADMEWRDLANYESAVRILNDRLLLYHVNDKDGLLELGDVYLDWGDNEDPEKYENARETYASLINLYGGNDLYMSRMMRYFIRTDNLREVLQLKESFFPRKKSLGAQDLTELSGYMFDKLIGRLTPAEEYLHDKITDVKALMERAIQADPSNPTALYNMARYFLQMTNNRDALRYLDASIDAFKKAPIVKKDDVYREIDAYRLKGELFVDQGEIVKAVETYTDGISVFRSQSPALPGKQLVGKLYSDMADIDYFKFNNTDAAYEYYKEAIANYYDTPSIRYRMGAIRYEQKAFPEALGSFINTAKLVPEDNNLLMALGNVLATRNSYSAARSYYEELLDHLNIIRSNRAILLPQVDEDDAEVVEMYMKAANNLGVTLYHLAKRTGDSNLNAQALVNLAESLRAWDALTRNQETMVRLSGMNLAEQNIQYITKPTSNFEPAIYPDIPRTLSGEKGID